MLLKIILFCSFFSVAFTAEGSCGISGGPEVILDYSNSVYPDNPSMDSDICFEVAPGSCSDCSL